MKKEKRPQVFALFKPGIVAFVFATGAAGYALSFKFSDSWQWAHFVVAMLSLLLLSAGSFALNQAQESKLDAKMPRTAGRPIPAGLIAPWQAVVLGLSFVAMGSLCALLINTTVFFLGLVTVFLYNIPYTLWWKRAWMFGAVPGAIPGAMPVLIGYAANNENVFTAEPLYLFMLMFLWQMPHFWSLAIRFMDDYRSGGVPVLPVALGVERTLFHMAMYMFTYCAFAAMAPFFTSVGYAYILLVVPLSFFILWQFFRFFLAITKQHQTSRWLPFFLWTNLSILVFVAAPVLDRWCEFWGISL